MLKKNRLLPCICLLVPSILFSPVALSDFEYVGQGTLTTETGQTERFQFGFSYLQFDGEYKFSAGKLSMAVDEVPKRYTLELVKNEQQQVWVSDFSKKPLLGFEWQIGGHQLQLKKIEPPSPKAGQYQLTIDNTEYFFTSKNRGQVHFKFNDKGIAEIDVGSMMTAKR